MRRVCAPTGYCLADGPHNSRASFTPTSSSTSKAGFVPDVAELLAILPDRDDLGGWRRAFWLYSPHALLEGRAPSDVFVTDPQRVIGVATRGFAGSQDAGW